MLIGTYRHQLDQKNRFRVPTKFKEVLKEGFIITKGTNGCLFAFSSEKFNELYSKLTEVPMFNNEAQKIIRALLSSAFETEEDKQGRILLPAELKKYADIEKNIVTIGVGNRIEIWAEEKFASQVEEASLDDASNALMEYGV